jgi:hypothetical protein
MVLIVLCVASNFSRRLALLGASRGARPGAYESGTHTLREHAEVPIPGKHTPPVGPLGA